jgi:hypothetical protein
MISMIYSPRDKTWTVSIILSTLNVATHVCSTFDKAMAYVNASRAEIEEVEARLSKAEAVS